AARDEKAAHREEHENAKKAEDQLVTGEDDERLAMIVAVRDEEGVRKDHRQRREEAQEVEIRVSGGIANHKGHASPAASLITERAKRPCPLGNTGDRSMFRPGAAP